MAEASKKSGYVDNWQTGKTVTECNLHMLTTEDSSDVIFRVGSEKHVVRAHRYVLVSRSCVFHAMFCGPLAEKGEVTIPDIEVTVFREFLRFLYTDTAKIATGNVTGLLYTSRKYGVDGLFTQCSHFLENSLCEENVCQILEQCHGYGEVDLEQKAFKILSEAGVQIIRSSGFLDLCETCLKRFVTSEYLNMEEKELFEAVLSWSRGKCEKENLSLTPENMRKYLGEIIYEIRFAVLPQAYLVSVVGPSGILTSDERLKIMDRTIDTNIDIAPFNSSRRTNSKRNASPSFIVSRYGSQSSAGWGVIGHPEAISFSVNKDVQLQGCQLFGPARRKESTYKLNILLYDDMNQVIAEPLSSSQMKLRGQGHLNDVIFPDPIPILAGPFYHVCVNITGESTDFGKEGKSFVKIEDVEFTFSKSPLSTRGLTTLEQGQIAGLIARLME